MKQRRIRLGFASMLASALVAGSIMTTPATAAPFAYVVNSCIFSGCPADVTVVDVANGTTVATVPLYDPSTGLGNYAPNAVTVAPDGMHAYVACNCSSFAPPSGNRNSPLLSVIDTATNTVVAQVFGPVLYSDQGTFALAVTPDGSRVYAVGSTGSATGAFNRAVFVVDTATNSVLTTIVDTRLNNPSQVAITPDGTRAYVTDFTGVVHVIDTNPASPTYNTILAEVAIPSSLVAESVAITPDGSRAYLPAFVGSNPFSGNAILVLVLDTNPASSTYNTFLTTVVGAGGANAIPAQVAITPDGTRAYVTEFNGNFFNGTGPVHLIDTNPSSSTYNTQLAAINIALPNVTEESPNVSNGIAITRDGTRAYVTSCAPSFDGIVACDEVVPVSVIDTNPTSPTYNTVIALVTAGVGPIDVAMERGPPPICESGIAGNFNGTPIASDRTIWFNSVLNVKGLSQTQPVTVNFSSSTITFKAGATSYAVNVPNAMITFDPTVTTATTTFDTVTNQWDTKVPSSGLAGNVFLDGVGFAVPTGGLPGGIKPVTWQGTFSSAATGIKVQWQWAAAVYTQLSTIYDSDQVKPVDDNHASLYQNSDHAGTPEVFRAFVVGGAAGGGGANYTGSYSGTASCTAAAVAGGS